MALYSEPSGKERARRIADRVDNPDALDRDQIALWKAFTPTKLQKYKHRDPDELAEAWADAETVREAADELEASRSTVVMWLAAFGIREPEADAPAKQAALATDPEDLDLEGSA